MLVSDAQRARLERLELRLYDLRTMTTGTTQFPGPQLGIGRAAGPTSEVADSSPPDIGRIMDMIQFFSEPEGWMEMGVGIDEINGTLAISNIPEVHEQIGDMLQGMERDAAMVINATVYRQDDIENLPNEISPEDWPAVRAELGRPVGNVLVKNGQRNHLASALSYNRVSGYAEVQGRIIPKRSPISEGLVVDLTLQQSAYRGLVSTARIQLVEPAGLSSRPMHFAENELTPSEKAEQVSHGSGDTRLLQPGGASVHIIGDATVIIHYQVIGPAQEDD